MSLLLAWKNFHRNRKIRRHYGELNPTHASLIGGDIPICVDPTDGRARKKLLLDSTRGRPSTNHTFWFQMIRNYKPTICIDIGLNYGECLLASRMPANAQGYGFEANTKLKQFVEQTLENHPDAERIHLYFSPVADRSGITVTLQVDPNWSGKSYISDKKEATGNTIATQMTTVTVDEQVPRPGENDRLLFKIDIEGFEPVAFKGMQQTIDACGRIVGFAEFVPEDLYDKGVDIGGYWSFLSERFTIYSCCEIGGAQKLTSGKWADAEQIIAGRHGDLILTKGLSIEAEAELLAIWRGVKKAD